jgi:G3E family GTPase
MVERIPFTVIGGFLGAGKTTLLRRWLQQAQGRRLAVLVNDFGAINLDAALLAQAHADTIALDNGCVCCAIGDDLGRAVSRVLQADPPFDGVVVEASGVSDPWRIAQVALAEPRLLLDGIVVLVDAAAWSQQAADPLLGDTLTRQLPHADLVLLNKADRADAGTLRAARDWVARHGGPAAVIDTVRAHLPPGLWQGRVDGADRADEHAGAAAPLPAAHGTQFESWSCRPQGHFDTAALRAWLRSLSPEVLRLKATLPVAEGWLDLQWAGRHASLRRLASVPAQGAALVAIGLQGRLPREALARGLHACHAAPAGAEQHERT